MRSLALLLVLLSFPLLAHCQVSEDEPLFANLDQCDELLTNGDLYTQESVLQVREEQWDQAWRFVDEGFMLYLGATNVCPNQERIEIANKLLNQNREVHKAMTCSFHLRNVKDASTRSKLAYEHIKDYEQSLNHAQFALYSVEEALKWCNKPEEQEALIKSRSMTILAIAQIEEMIAYQNEHPE